ncbi:pentatricopeptide repeat-containing protein At2g33760 isoform X1 [Cucumis sativus]|uniref:pentatricopeptide repeat-containing protein At2g33760 isoform X1 n=1 Tax=Cucumis sativus TaxID=3659 RepID=UPI0002B445D6|nr:pentatricopeptide repeat-containing protein At2g33760 isoform X1 [Cucumis sativus]XP_031742767.1 pentatricopeptide repeat-containing protein At2g33760 isoform X1 [Cucumis sativus]XP_031742768.1 pentatricopeptide repeat-containing protein At2g33760 isoform X1 [Cucumis sativus]XP_031742769.1 pentatricopeptide repeat-containing protein At2g33760 isoform X1 [Cucumis sativus]XP_031742770.1 pentatricopeptide repeat-containing protein At2g33760 isoform X1 [Cucumis sativus]XP_031742771.1 pentatrico
MNKIKLQTQQLAFQHPVTRNFDTQSHSPVHEALLRSGPRLRNLQQVHAHIIVSGLHRSRSLLTKLISLVCTAGSITYARRLFPTVPNPDSFLFDSLLKVTSKFGFSIDTVLFYRRMLFSGAPQSNYTFTSVIKACADLSALRLGKEIHSHVMVCGYGSDMYVQAALIALYAKASDMKVAKKVFDAMPQRTIIAWNSLISGYDQNGLPQESIGLFHLMMESGFQPDSATIVSLLSSCSQLGALDFGCWLHDYADGNGFDLNVVLGTSLINMYTRCGNVSKAREVFDSMKERNVVTWTAMISGYGMHGYGRQAMELFTEMRAYGPRPNNITFVAVLSACAHSGLIDDGRRVFSSMKEAYGLVPGVEHNVCMVDMFGRAGLLNDAYQFIKKFIPKEPGPAVWTSMLGACRMHRNFDLGVKVAEHVLSVEPENPGHYVMLSNIYALAGRMDRVEMVRNMMTRRRLKKQVGYSTIEINRKTYLFSMGDKSHPQTNTIYRYLDELMCRCSESGYVPAPESLMHDLEEEERDYALRYHSEKLALAFGLLKTNQGETIRIVKNLRICEDCHSAIKHISIIADREIIVRDKFRFHHFKDGSCSCLDYW